MDRTAASRLALITVGAGIVFAGGWLVGRHGARSGVTNTAFSEYGKLLTSRVAGLEFQAYGRFSTRGLVVRVFDEAAGEAAHCRSILVVDDPEGAAHAVGSYEVYHDRGVYQVSMRNRLIPFSILHVANQERIVDVQVGDRVRLSGEYGEIEYRGGATCSLSNLGIFVCAIAESEVRHPAVAAVR